MVLGVGKGDEEGGEGYGKGIGEDGREEIRRFDEEEGKRWIKEGVTGETGMGS